LKNDHLSKYFHRQDVTRNICCKHLRTTAPIRLASTASIISTILESTNLKEPQSHALIAALDHEWEIGNINKKIVDDGSTNNSNDEDYSDMSNTTDFKIGG
jgi:hypothetical protein